MQVVYLFVVMSVAVVFSATVAVVFSACSVAGLAVGITIAAVAAVVSVPLLLEPRARVGVRESLVSRACT